MSWQPGRQGTGYLKKLLWFGPLPFGVIWFDAYLLKFPEGSHIYWHKDPVEKGEKHYRLNVFLKSVDVGGKFVCEGKTILNTRFVQCFRPDIQRHMVTKIEKGTRYVLSIGWVTR